MKIFARGYVYIGYDWTNYGFKIGRTNNIAKREQEIRNMNPTYTMLVSVEVEDSKKSEKQLHEKYADKRFGGEWFDLSAKDVVDAVKLLDPSHPINEDLVRTATGRKDI